MTGPTSSQRAQLKYPVTFSERWSQMELKRTLQQFLKKGKKQMVYSLSLSMFPLHNRNDTINIT